MQQYSLCMSLHYLYLYLLLRPEGCRVGVGDGSCCAGRMAGWPVTVGMVKVGGVSQPGADAERYRCACWLGVVTGISAALLGAF